MGGGREMQGMRGWGGGSGEMEVVLAVSIVSEQQVMQSHDYAHYYTEVGDKL